MDIDKIMQLIDKVGASGISSLTLEEGCLKINIEKNGRTALTESVPQYVPVNVPQLTAAEVIREKPAVPAAPAQSPVSAEDQGNYISSPIVGVFYTAAGPDEAPYVRVGDMVQKGQVVGIVEAMKLMNDIESDVSGIVEEILVSNQEGVEYGQPLFKIK